MLGSFCFAKIVKLVVWVVEIFLLCCDDMGFGLVLTPCRLVGGVFRRERRRKGAAGASRFRLAEAALEWHCQGGLVARRVCETSTP